MAQSLIAQPRSLIVPRRGFRKPARPVLDPNDPINRALGSGDVWLPGYSAQGLVQALRNAANNGTIGGTGAIDAAKFGGTSLKFNGTNTDILTGLKQVTKTTPTWCVVLVKYTANWFGFITNLDSATSAGWGFSEMFGAGHWGFLMVDGAESNGFARYSTGTLNNNTWHVLGFDYAGSVTSGGITIYQDGKVDTGNQVNLGTGDPGTLVDSGTYIGAVMGSPGSYLTGSIAILRFGVGNVLGPSGHARLSSEPYAGIYEAGPRWRVGKTGGGTAALSGKSYYILSGRSVRSGTAGLHGIERSGLIGRLPLRGAASLIGQERSAAHAQASRGGTSVLKSRLLSAFRGLGSRAGKTSLTGKAGTAFSARPRIVTGLIALLARSAAMFSGRASRTGTGALKGRAPSMFSGKGYRAGTASLHGRGLARLAGRGRLASGLIVLLARSAAMFSGRASRTGTASLHGQSRSRLMATAKGLFLRSLSARSQYRVTSKGNMIRMVPLRANMMTLTYARASRTGTVPLKATARSFWRALLYSVGVPLKASESVVVPSQNNSSVVPAQRNSTVIGG